MGRVQKIPGSICLQEIHRKPMLNKRWEKEVEKIHQQTPTKRTVQSAILLF